MSQSTSAKLLMRFVCLSILSINLVFAVIAAPTSADGTEWTSQVGKITFANVIKNTAVFKYKTPGVQNSSTWLFINNSVNPQRGTLPSRGSFSGYWMDDSNRTLCEAAIVAPTGTRSHSWGRFEITFIADAIYPNWTGSLSDCFEQPTRNITATKFEGNSDRGTTNHLITANSVGSIRLGMTVTEARRAMADAMFEGNSDSENYRVLVGDRVVMALTPGETYTYDNEGNATPLNDNAKIDSITVFDSRYRTADGIQPRMSISEAEKKYGKTKLTWDPEGGESVRFANQPKHLGFNLAGSNRIGIYRVGGNLVPENDFGDLSKGFETSNYASGAEVYSISVSGTGDSGLSNDEPNYLITTNSVGDIRLGMTIADARKVFKGAEFDRWKGYAEVTVEVKQGGKTIVTLTVEEMNPNEENDDGVAPADETATIYSIETSDVRYKTADGVHTGMTINEVEQRFGKLKEISYQLDPRADQREHAKFSNQPERYSFTVAGKAGEASDGAKAGIYLDDEYKFVTDKYVANSVITSVRITSPEETTGSEPNLLLTENSAGDIRLGMTVTEARKVFPGAKFEQYDESEEGRWISISRGEKTLLRVASDQKYTEPDNDGIVPIDDSAKIDIIEISDSRYKSADGVHVGMLISEAEKKFGKIKEIIYYGLDGSEHPTFTNKTGYAFEVAPANAGENFEAKAGIYRGDDVKTTRYAPGAVISEITLVSGDNEEVDEPAPGPWATVNAPGDVLNMRAIPNHRTGLLVTRIPHGERVIIQNCEANLVRIGSRSGHWCRVSYQGLTGWVFDPYLDKD